MVSSISGIFSRRRLLASGSVCVTATVLALAQPSNAQRSTLKIGIIGAGHIGGELAKLWADAGYKVVVSARDLDAVRQLVAQIGPNAKAGTPAQAAQFGNVVVISVPYSALPEIGKDYGALLKGKVVLDTCNPVLDRDGPMAREALEKGTGVVDPQYLPGTRLVRAFNQINYRSLANDAHRSSDPIAIPLAGDDKRALQIASQLVRDAGFEPVIVGGLDKARSFDLGQAGSKLHSVAEFRSELGAK